MTSSPKRIFIVEDHQLFREGLKSMLSRQSAYEVVGESADGHKALQRIQKLKPDIILLDLTMPKINGYSVLREIRRQFSTNVKVLVLSIHDSDQHVLQAFEEGADGYCVKDSTFDALQRAINSVLAGKRHISPEIADKVLEGYTERSLRLKPKSAWDTVTHREKEVLKLIGEGYTNKKIASLLNISSKTVDKHRSSIMKKLDLHNAAALAAYAAEKGLLA